ncbi:MAG: hypothetical protein M1836_005798 [Candelina mexicana]|nr:MAG: hypothetical protein M1836_005798 [Candelina mexicana]
MTRKPSSANICGKLNDPLATCFRIARTRKRRPEDESQGHVDKKTHHKSGGSSTAKDVDKVAAEPEDLPIVEDTPPHFLCRFTVKQTGGFDYDVRELTKGPFRALGEAVEDWRANGIQFVEEWFSWIGDVNTPKTRSRLPQLLQEEVSMNRYHMRKEIGLGNRIATSPYRSFPFFQI